MAKVGISPMVIVRINTKPKIHAASLARLRKVMYLGRSVQRQAGALSFHSLRRTATTLLHEAGVPAAVVQSLIGHDSEEVHQLCVAVGKDALASAAARLPDLA